MLRHAFPQSWPSFPRVTCCRTGMWTGATRCSSVATVPAQVPVCAACGPSFSCLCPSGPAVLTSWGSWSGGRSLGVGSPAVAGLASLPVRPCSEAGRGPLGFPCTSCPVSGSRPPGPAPKITCPAASFPEESPFLPAACWGHAGEPALQPQRPDAVGTRQQVERPRPGGDHRRDAGGDRLGARAR